MLLESFREIAEGVHYDEFRETVYVDTVKALADWNGVSCEFRNASCLLRATRIMRLEHPDLLVRFWVVKGGGK